MTQHDLTANLPQKAYIIVVFLLLSCCLPSFSQSVDNNGSLRKCWELNAAGLAGDTLTSDGESVFVSSDGGIVHAVDAISGQNVWTAHLGGEIVSNIIASEEAVFVVANAVGGSGNSVRKSNLRSLSKNTGVTNWTAEVPSTEKAFLGYPNRRIVFVGIDGTVTALSENGEKIWTRTHSAGVVGRPGFSENRVVFGTGDNHLLLISANDGKQLLDLKTAFDLTSVAFSVAGHLIAGDERGNVILLNADTGDRIWKFKSGAAISLITKTKHGVLVSSHDNFVYLISDDNGDVIWKRRLPGRVADGVMVGDESFFTMMHAEQSAYSINVANGKIVDKVDENERSFLHQVPLSVGSDRIVFATSQGLESYGRSACSHK